MEDSVEPIINEIQERLPAASTWIYIAIWAIADMIRRSHQNPKNPQFANIHFPHTEIPLFTAEQAKRLEAAWPTEAFQQAYQAGGGFKVPDLKTLSKGAQTIGSTMGTVLNNPELVSIDDKFEKITGALDGWDEALTEVAKQYSLPALEAVAPDPKFVIPLGPIPIPVMMPVRLVLPTLNAILELVRVASTMIAPIEILGKPTTLLMVFLDLARGNLYHAIFSMLGFWGKYPLYTGIVLKIVRDAYMLIAPDIRTELRSAIYKSGKSMTVGWIIWLFGIVAPEIVRKPIVALLDQVKVLADTYNQGVAAAEVKASAALKGFGTVELPKMPSTRIPTIGDMYILQEWVHNPNIYCHPQVAPILAELRGIPPMALFLDLFNIPKVGSREYEAACAKVAATPLAQQLAPHIKITSDST